MMDRNTVTIVCPECQQPIHLQAELVVGLQTICQACGTDFVVTWLFPICLDYLEANEAEVVHDNLS
jgi:hypothetical protein